MIRDYVCEKCGKAQPAQVTPKAGGTMMKHKLLAARALMLAAILSMAINVKTVIQSAIHYYRGETPAWFLFCMCAVAVWVFNVMLDVREELREAKEQTAEEIRPVLPAFKRDVTGEADPLATLTALAEARNGSAFAHAVAAMAWDAFTPGEIAQAVRLALAAGAFLPARYISAEGHRLYPENAELANMARILAPPKVLGTRPANPSAGRDLEWLRQHASEYRGQWLALKDGQFLAAASTARELQAALPRIQGIFVTRVA